MTMLASRELERQTHRAARSVTQEELQDDDSDTEESNLILKLPDAQIIHSGHFMVSSPHIEHPPKKGYDFDTVNKQTCHTYHFGKASTSHLSIDASLTKLFECMTLAYSGKLVSPKWKNFKGLKLLWRDKIRLNNAIWRAWYMQYVEKRDNPVCHFVTPLDGSMSTEDHRPAEAVAMEGKYWKRRIEIVIREYHKWRTYFKKRLQKHKDDDLSSLLKGAEEQFSLFGEMYPDTFRVSLYQDDESLVRRGTRKSRESPVPMEMDFDVDVLMSEFTDTLFSTLASHQPVPNPREIAHTGNADMIQPGLIPLQPNLDLLETLDPLQDFFPVFRQSSITFTSATTSSIVSSDAPHASASVVPSHRPANLSNVKTSTGTLLQSPLCVLPPRSSVNEQSSLASAYTPGSFPSRPPVALPLMQAPSVSPALTHPVLQSQNGTPSPLGILDITQSSQGNAPLMAAPGDTTPNKNSAFVLPQGTCKSQRPFALPRPIKSSSGGMKTRPLKPILLASTQPSVQLILPEVVPFTSQTPRFRVQAQGQKYPQIIVPKEEMASSSSSKAQTLSANSVRDGHCSNQGSSCGQEVAPSPQSPPNSVNSLAKTEANQSRRVNHISAEQKRRFNINNGFKTLCGLVPTLKAQSNAKPISNALTLQKTVEYIGKLQQERLQMQEETKRLREEIEELNSSINSCQEQLPATGVPITRHRFDHMRDKFDEYVKSRTFQNWKFWIFSIIIKPLFESFNGGVSTTSMEELQQTTLLWLDSHCTLPVLRPMVLTTLRQLSISTSILTDPSLMAEEARQAVLKGPKQSG